MTIAKWKVLFSKNLNNQVQNSGLSPNQFREQAGFTSATWHNYINEKRLPRNPSDIEKIAKVTGINPAALFGWMPALIAGTKSLTLSSNQLTYPAGSALHYTEVSKELADGQYLFMVDEQPILKRITRRLDGRFDVLGENGVETYDNEKSDSFKVLGKVTAVTLVIS